jgi:hypothetical protein
MSASQGTTLVQAHKLPHENAPPHAVGTSPTPHHQNACTAQTSKLSA